MAGEPVAEIRSALEIQREPSVIMKQVLGVVFLAFITGLVVVGVKHYLIDPPLPVARAASQPTGGAAPAAPDEGDAVPGQRELVLKPGFASPLPATAAEINGQRVNFVFVPKAPMVILSLTDARRVGFQIEQLEFVDNGHMSRGEARPRGGRHPRRGAHRPPDRDRRRRHRHRRPEPLQLDHRPQLPR